MDLKQALNNNYVFKNFDETNDLVGVAMKSQTWCIIVLLCLIPALATQAQQTSPVIDGTLVNQYGENLPLPVIPGNVPGFSSDYNELDEIMGDTLFIGNTYWESQHNGTVGRMIGFEPDHPDYGPTIHISWTDLYEENGDRHVKFTRIWEEENEWVIEEPDGYVVDGGSRAGYTTLAMNSEDGISFPSYHTTPVVDLESAVAFQDTDFPDIFWESIVPAFGGNISVWPHVAWGEYNGTEYIHMVNSENREEPTDAMDILYSRHEYDPDALEIVTSEQSLVTSDGMNIGVDVAVSHDGARVAVATTMSRFHMLNEGDDASQFNNDIYLWISEDAGETWDWDNPIDVTAFQGPEGGEDRDTLRAYTDCNVYFDYDDVLHVAFTLSPTYIEPNLSTSNMGMIFHWDEASNVVTLTADGMFWNMALPGAWQRIVGRPSMYQDPESGILWMVYQQYGVPGNNLDISDDNYANGEIFVTASPPGDFYSRLWTEGVNITNTQYDEEGGAAAGDCANEREPSIALNNDGDYLNIFYVLDLDAGFVVQEEGEYTDNPVVYHRVDKQDLIDEFNLNATWLQNIPIHIDSTQFWDDLYAWDWDDHGGTFFAEDITLQEFFLHTDTLDFGEVLVGQSDTMWVVMENIGESDLTIINVIPGLEAFNVEEVENVIIGPAALDSFYVEFIPSVDANFQSPIIINTNDVYFNNEEVTVQLLGTGTNIPAPINAGGMVDPIVAEAMLWWGFEDVPDLNFIEFNLYRGLELVWSGIDTVAVENLENVPPGALTYTVTALFEEGESSPTEPIDLLWLAPAHNINAELEAETGIVSLSWEYLDWDMDEFIEFRVYRKDEQILTCETLFCEDDLSEEEPGTYVYEVSVIYDEGESVIPDSVEVEWEGLSSIYDSDGSIPDRWALASVYPNPFNSTVRATIAVPETGRITMLVYDLLGREVNRIDSGWLQPGHHQFSWTPGTPSGVYFLAVSNGSWKETRKIVYMK